MPDQISIKVISGAEPNRHGTITVPNPRLI